MLRLRREPRAPRRGCRAPRDRGSGRRLRCPAAGRPPGGTAPLRARCSCSSRGRGSLSRTCAPRPRREGFKGRQARAARRRRCCALQAASAAGVVGRAGSFTGHPSFRVFLERRNGPDRCFPRQVPTIPRPLGAPCCLEEACAIFCSPGCRTAPIRPPPARARARTRAAGLFCPSRGPSQTWLPSETNRRQ